MEELFASLSRRQTMMLLTAVTFGGQDALPVLGHLPEEEAAVLRHRAGKMLEIPRERRIHLLVQEIKRLVTARKGHLWSAEPELLAGLLARERSALRELILRALPVALADAVRLHLPPSAVAVRDELPPGVLGIIRWKLEGLLQQASAGTLWKFSDLLMLKPRELYTLADRQGCRALATAIAALLAEEQAAFFEALPPELSALAQRAVAAAAGRELPQQDARALLAQHGAEGSPLDAIRSAGIQRIVRACLAQGPDFAPRLLERHRPPFAPLFQKWMNDERTRAAAKGDGGRAEIVADLERLEARGLMEKPSRLPAMSRKPVVPPPAAQVRGRPLAPVPPAAAHRALPSEGLPARERTPVPSRTPPVPAPALAAPRGEQPPAAPDWHAPPGAVDPRASRALRTRLPPGSAPVIAPLPQRPAPDDAWGEAPPKGRPTGAADPERQAAVAPRGEGRLQGRSTPPAEGAEARPAVPARLDRPPQVPRSRQGASAQVTGRPGHAPDGAGDRGGGTAVVPPPAAEPSTGASQGGATGMAGSPRRASGATPGLDEKTTAMRPPRSSSGAGPGGDEQGRGTERPHSAPIVGSLPGRPEARPALLPEEAPAREAALGRRRAPEEGRSQEGSRRPGANAVAPVPQRLPPRRTPPAARDGRGRDAENPGAADEGAGAVAARPGPQGGTPTRRPPAPGATSGFPDMAGDDVPMPAPRPPARGPLRRQGTAPAPAGPDGGMHWPARPGEGGDGAGEDERTASLSPAPRGARGGAGEGPGGILDDERTTGLRAHPRREDAQLDGEPPADPQDEEQTATFRPPSRAGQGRPAAADVDGRTRSPRSPSPGGAEAAEPGSGAAERTTAFRPPSRGGDERTAAFPSIGPGPAGGAEPAPRRTSQGRVPGPGGNEADDEGERTQAFRPPPRGALRPALPSPGRESTGEVGSAGMRGSPAGTAVAEGAGEPGRAVPPAREASGWRQAGEPAPEQPVPAEDGPTGAHLPFRSPASEVSRGGSGEDAESTTAAMSPLPGGPGRVPPGDAPPPPAGDPSKRTVARDSEADGPEPKEELTAPKLPRASAGRVQGTAHLRTDGPPRGPVVTRPPQRRRSDSRIRKAVEPPIAPSPPAAPPPSASPRSPRVVGSSTRHKAVKGPGRGPGGGTG